MTFRSIAWEADRLVLLDQTRLPHEEVYMRLEDASGVFEAIRALRVRGAPAIGLAAAFGLYLDLRSSDAQDAASFRREARKVAGRLASARPTAVNLRWALDRMMQVLTGAGEAPVPELKEALLTEAQRMLAEDEAACRAIGEHGLTLLQDGMRILTHCNAGALGTSRYGTAAAPLYLAKERGWRLTVYADETRPVLQGARLTAWELQRAGIEVRLLVDAAAAAACARGLVDAVIVGADRVAANGDVANKIGTYGLALAAAAHGTPFYVAAPLSSIDPASPSGDAIPIEERPAWEVTALAGSRVAPEGVSVWNPAFDVTPARLVTAIITEAGIVRPPFEESLRRVLRVEGAEA